MNTHPRILILLAVCAILLIVGFVFSAHITASITGAAHQEATRHAPVPTPPAPTAKPAAH